MALKNVNLNFRIRSYAGRHGRQTAAQSHALTALWPQFGLEIAAGEINQKTVFGAEKDCFLEIGFGNGQSLMAAAEANPEMHFIGVETHRPGVGALLHNLRGQQITNTRVYQADAIDVLQQCIANEFLAGILIFFPDPWPKRRHFPRRLVKETFLNLCIQKLKTNGVMHFATDWEDYAKQMLRVLSAQKKLTNLAGCNMFAERSSFRPVLTKFEKRAEREKRAIWELQFKKIQ